MKEIAEVLFSCGRHYLKVAGVILAMEADVVRDPRIDETRWTTESLRDAAAKINEAAG